ncbi:MAG: STAS domain-containing protein [Verrucomicrobia bacterium]|nr:STAS domain-containing protein [Verrucomicrobiota bacterium]
MTPFALNLRGTNLLVTFHGEITIEHTLALAGELKQSLQSGYTLEVDASQMTRLDAAGLQILLSSAQFAADTTLSASSAAWTDAFARYASPDPFRSI